MCVPWHISVELWYAKLAEHWNQISHIVWDYAFRVFLYSNLSFRKVFSLSFIIVTFLLQRCQFHRVHFRWKLYHSDKISNVFYSWWDIFIQAVPTNRPSQECRVLLAVLQLPLHFFLPMNLSLLESSTWDFPPLTALGSRLVICSSIYIYIFSRKMLFFLLQRMYMWKFLHSVFSDVSFLNTGYYTVSINECHRILIPDE